MKYTCFYFYVSTGCWVGQGDHHHHQHHHHILVQSCDCHLPPSFGRSVPIASIDSPNENLTEAGGKYAPVAPRWSHMENEVCLCCGWSKSWEVRSVGWGITWIVLWSRAGVKANTLSGGSCDICCSRRWEVESDKRVIAIISVTKEGNIVDPCSALAVSQEAESF